MLISRFASRFTTDIIAVFRLLLAENLGINGIFANFALLSINNMCTNNNSASFADHCNEIFDACVVAYHVTDHVDAPVASPFAPQSIENTLFEKCLIDARQWHLEDIIRDPEIDPVAALALKRRIDASNQERTDMVEQLDDFFRQKYASVEVLPNATINTETPAWALDRLSILALKIYHMKVEAERADASAEHRSRCQGKLDILLQQRVDLSSAIDALLDDIATGRKYMKVYRQMKMYNDADTNPVLYASK